MPPPPSAVEVARASVAGMRSPRVALVVRGDRPVLVERLSSALPDAQLRVLDVEEGMDAVHLALTAGRPWDVVVDVAGPGAARRWRVMLHHLRPGGRLALRVPEDGAPVLESVAEVTAMRRSGAEPPAPGRDLRASPVRDLAALAASTDDLRISDGWLHATSVVDTLAKVPDSAADDFLLARPGAGSTLLRLPAVKFTSRCALRSSAPVDLPDEYEAPAVSLREYADVVCLGRQAAYGDGFVLPESYRHPFRPRLRNVAFAEWAPRFVRRPEAPTAKLAGPMYLVDTYVPGHFGHALTDQLGHLWGWHTALERHPELRALVFPAPGEDLAEWEYDLLAAGGIERERVVVAYVPTAVELLVASSPMFAMPAYVHPGIATTYAAVGTALAARATADRPGPLRVFCSRRPGKRTCHNAGDVEAMFESHGFTVMFPEDHPLPEQVRLVRGADVVAGFAGSGMFQIAFAGGPKHVVLVASESYTATNEYLISSVVGHRLDLALCRPDVPKKGDRFSQEWYHSDFTFDDAREGVFLREVLAGL